MNLRVTEFQCIMPLENIPSVLKLGILSNERSAKFEHFSVAMEDVQEKREQKNVPGGLKLHQYANLYFHARNPMLYKRKNEINNLCVLRVSIEVLQLPGVVLADCNASSPYVRFLAPSQWALLDYEAIYAMDWNRQMKTTRMHIGSIKQKSAQKFWCRTLLKTNTSLEHMLLTRQ